MYQSSNQKQFARKLRSEATDTERLLWSRLRKRQLKACRFRRQFAIGPYVVDFECFEHRLIVELDGGQHNTPEARTNDDRRAEYLRSHGYRVIRYWNYEVTDDLEAVLESIASELEERSQGRPHPGPPPQGEGDSVGDLIE